MKFTIVTPKGVSVNTEVEYIVTCGKDGQLGVLKNHVPVIIPIETGYVKTVTGEDEVFYAVSGAIVEFSNDNVNVIAQESVSGKTKDEALVNFEAARTSRKSENRRRMMDFTEMEKELALNLKQIKASQL